jgi:aminoglycoside phosphotransferase (APT) family kinase protein
VPQVLGVDEPLGAFVMEMLPASEHANWKAELLAGRPHVEVGAQMGDLLGRLHASTSREAALAQRFANDANFFALRLDPYLLETARQNPDLSGELMALVHTTQTNAHALVHGDVSPKNILLGMHGPVLLDAECAWWGDPAFDLAFLLNHMLLKSVRLPLLASDCAALFTGIAEAHAPHVTWEPPHAFEARAAALLPALLLARVDGKSPVEYLSEAQRTQVRAVARPLVRQPRRRLRDVLHRFQAALLEADAA